MASNIERFLDIVEVSRRMTINVRIDGGPGYASLGTDVLWLHKVHFCVGVAEVVGSYVLGRTGISTEALYSDEISGELGGMFARIGHSADSWVDFYERQSYPAEQLFRVHLARRRGGPWAAGADDILRVDLVGLTKENPTLLQIIATGATTTMLALGMCFGGVQLMKEYGAQACREQYLDYSARESERIHRTARLEGRFTKEHEAALGKVRDMVNAGIAACGSSLRDADVTLESGDPPKVGIHVGQQPHDVR
jgi:hypothetical protein